MPKSQTRVRLPAWARTPSRRRPFEVKKKKMPLSSKPSVRVLESIV
jgi:hypothetical protein